MLVSENGELTPPHCQQYRHNPQPTSSLDSLINKLTKLTERSTKSIQIHNNLSNKVQHLHENIMDQERSIDEINTRIENSNIYIQHLTSLNLRSKFFEKQLNDFDNQTVIISATKNQGFEEFQDWKQRNLNWRTTETTFENMCLEYTYLKEQLQQANNFHDLTTDTIDDNDNNQHHNHRSHHYPHHHHHISNGYINDYNNDSSSIIDSSSNVFSAGFDDTFITSNDTMAEDITPHTTPLVVPKKRLLKKESFLNVPYKAQLYETPDTAITPIRGFHIHKRSLSSDPTVVASANDYSESKKSCLNLNLSQYQPQDQHQYQKQQSNFNNTLLPSIEETSFDETVIISPKEEKPNLRVETSCNYNDFLINKQYQQEKITDEFNQLKQHAQIPKRSSIHKRHNSLPETPDFFNYQEEYFDTPLDKVDHDFYKDLKVSKQQRLSSINSSISFGSDNQSSLRHFVSYDTGLHLNKRFGSTSFSGNQGHGLGDSNQNLYSTSPFSKPNYSSIREKHEIFYSDIDSEVETLPESQNNDNESYGNEAKPHMLEQLGKPFLKRSTSHESIFSKYDIISIDQHSNQQLPPFPIPEYHSTSSDLKTQTMKWLTPNQPTVSSSTVKIFDPSTNVSSSLELLNPFIQPKATSAAVTARSIQYKPKSCTTSTTNSRDVLNSVVSNNPLLSHIHAQRNSITSFNTNSEEVVIPQSTALHRRQNSSISWLSNSLFTSHSTDNHPTNDSNDPVSPTISSCASSIFTTSALVNHHRNHSYHKFKPGHSTKSSLSTNTTTTASISHSKRSSIAGSTYNQTSSSTNPSNSWITNMLPNSSMITSETGRYIGQPSSHPVTEADLSKINVCSYAPVSPVTPGSAPGSNGNQHLLLMNGMNGFGFTKLNGNSSTSVGTDTVNSSSSTNPRRSVAYDNSASLNSINNGKNIGNSVTGRLGKPGQTATIIRYSGRVNNSSGGVERVLSSRVSHGALRDALDSSMSFSNTEEGDA